MKKFFLFLVVLSLTACKVTKRVEETKGRGKHKKTTTTTTTKRKIF